MAPKKQMKDENVKHLQTFYGTFPKETDTRSFDGVETGE